MAKMAKRKVLRGATALTEAQFVNELAIRLDVSIGEARKFVKGFKQTVGELVVTGHKVTLTGLVRFEPKLVAEKKKGEMVRNPATGETAPRAKNVPASFKVKAYASSAIGKLFPSTRSKSGKALAEQLAAKK